MADYNPPTIQSGDVGGNSQQKDPTQLQSGPQGPDTGPAQPNTTRIGQPGQGTGYTNIQRIMQANTGNTLGQSIGSGITQQAQNTKQNVGQAQQQFQQQSQQNAIGTQADNSKVQSVLQNIQTNANYQPTQDEIATLQKYQAGQYGGPTSLQNADALRAQAQNTQQLGQLTGSAQGRTALLQRFAGGPAYNMGQQTLDSLLLGQTGAQPLAQARRQALSVTPQTESAITGAQAQGLQLQNQAAGFGQQVGNQLVGQISDIDKAAQAQQKTDVATQQRLSDELAKGTISADDAKALGLDLGPSGSMRLYGLGQNNGLLSYLNQTAPTALQAASADQVARMQALGQLAGGQYAAQAQPTLSQYQDKTQAGSFDKTPLFNKDQFNTALNAQKSAYDKQAAAPTAWSNYSGNLLDMNAQQALNQQAIDKVAASHGLSKNETGNYVDATGNPIDPTTILPKDELASQGYFTNQNIQDYTSNVNGYGELSKMQGIDRGGFRNSDQQYNDFINNWISSHDVGESSGGSAKFDLATQQARLNALNQIYNGNLTLAPSTPS